MQNASIFCSKFVTNISLKPNFLYISTLSGRQVRINFFLPQAIVFVNDDMAFSGYRVYEKRGHKVGKDLYEAKNTTRALSVELKMAARSATISVFKV